MSEPTISLQTYAAVIAALGAGLPLSRALAHGEVEPSLWEEASERWQERIDESAATDLADLVAFDGALLAERRRFSPTYSPIASDIRAFAHFRRHVLTALDPQAFLIERGMSLDRYAMLEADWTARALTDEAAAAALQRHMEEPLDGCPAITEVPSPLLADPARDRPASPPVENAAEVEIAPPPAMPAPPLPAPPAPVEPPRAPVGSATGMLDPAMIRAALPFARGAGEPARPAEAVRTLKTGDVAVTGALPADLVARIARGALPFAKGSAAPAASSEPPVPPQPQTPSSGNTGPIPVLRPAATALPFQAPAAASAPVAPHAPPALSLDQYAQLCAELAVRPAESEATFARHGLGATRDRIAVDLSWQERLRRNPEEYRVWQEAYQRHRATLTERGGR